MRFFWLSCLVLSMSGVVGDSSAQDDSSTSAPPKPPAGGQPIPDHYSPYDRRPSYSGDAYSAEPYPAEAYASEGYPAEPYPTGQYPADQYSADQYSAELYAYQYANEQYEQDPAYSGAGYANAGYGPQNYGAAPPAYGESTPAYVADAGRFYGGGPAYSEPAYDEGYTYQPPAGYVPPEAPPLEEQTLPPPEASSYRWFDSSTWFPVEAWSSTLELGINGVTGNAESFSVRTGANLERKTDALKQSLAITYAKTTTGSTLTQHNAYFTANSEWTISDTPVTMFGAYNLEYDEFRAFDLRAVFNGGLGYKLYNTGATTFTSRVGAGASREIGGPDDDIVPEAVFGLELNHQLTKRQKLSAKSTYTPEWANFDDYRIVTDIGWEMLLDDAANMSLKLGVIDRYDSTPNGRKPNDLDYSLLLLWKL